MNFREILVETAKWSASSPILDFRNGGKSRWCPFSCAGSKFKCLQLIYCWKGNFIKIEIVLRARVQKWASFELLIEKRKGMFLKL